MIKHTATNKQTLSKSVTASINHYCRPWQWGHTTMPGNAITQQSTQQLTLHAAFAAFQSECSAEEPRTTVLRTWYIRTRYRISWAKTSSQRDWVGATCSFGLFKYDSFMPFRAIGVIWGIWELTAELLCLPFWTLFLVPTLWETNNQDMINHLYVGCPGVGQVARGLRTLHPFVNCKSTHACTCGQASSEQGACHVSKFASKLHHHLRVVYYSITSSSIDTVYLVHHCYYQDETTACMSLMHGFGSRSIQIWLEFTIVLFFLSALIGWLMWYNCVSPNIVDCLRSFGVRFLFIVGLTHWWYYLECLWQWFGGGINALLT